MGISIFTILPIPSFIPAETITAVKVMKIVCHMSKFNGDEITFENCSVELINPVEVAEIKI